ncbi:MAG: alpha/beta hydrolase, partial [Candidatus Aenigmatarchaeota archaeon]
MKEETLTLFDSVGRRIAGVIHRPEGPGPFPAVVLAHGFKSSKGRKRGLAEALCKAGFVAVRFDFFGSGDSDGSFENVTISKMAEDLRFVVEHTSRLHYVRDTGLAGSSMGGMVSIIQAAQDSRVKALVLDRPVSDFKGLPLFKLMRSQEFEAWREKGIATLTHPGEQFQVKFNFYQDGLKYDLYHLASRIDCPSLIIHGSKDRDVPLEQSKRLFGVLGSEQKDLQVMEGADHDWKEAEKA